MYCPWITVAVARNKNKWSSLFLSFHLSFSFFFSLSLSLPLPFLLTVVLTHAHIFLSFPRSPVSKVRLHSTYIYVCLCVHVCVNVYVCISSSNLSFLLFPFRNSMCTWNHPTAPATNLTVSTLTLSLSTMARWEITAGKLSRAPPSKWLYTPMIMRWYFYACMI